MATTVNKKRTAKKPVAKQNTVVKRVQRKTDNYEVICNIVKKRNNEAAELSNKIKDELNRLTKLFDSNLEKINAIEEQQEDLESRMDFLNDALSSVEDRIVDSLGPTD